MPGTNSFYPYGESSTNILNNSEYQTDSERSSGAQSGAIARSKMYNKQARQAAAGAYAVGALVAKSGKNADDSSAAALAANFQAAVNYQAAHFVASDVSVSGTTATATVAELATTAAADLPALFALSLVLDQALPAGASIAIASSLPDVTLSWPIYVGGEVLDSDTITGGAITLLIDTVGAKAFFKAGGGGKVPADLPPLLPNFALEFSGTTVTVTANKLPLNDKTSMLAGGVWVLASTIPDSPKGAIVKEWSQSDLIDSTQDTESSEVVTWTYEGWSAGEPIYCRQYTYNEKGQYNTALYGGLVSTEDVTFKLPEFTGNHAIFGDEIAGRIELYESGDLTLSPGTYDFFLVGGGGAGYKGRYSESSNSTGGGGAGGKTFTQKAVTVPKLTACPALVGAGGSQSGITVNDSNFSAQAGGGANQSKGGSGGSGGGGGGAERGNVHGGSGGSDGSNGADGYSKTEYHKGGTGQGTTTKSFGEVGGTLYAGGGGGGACPGMGAGAAGGAGGGGNGGNGSSNSSPATAGTANTGGGGGGGADRYNSPGGAGGSGIIIVRWNNA